jgi:hypothetical protein
MTPTAHVKLDATIHAKFRQLSLLLPNLFAFIHCSLHLTTFSP